MEDQPVSFTTWAGFPSLVLCAFCSVTSEKGDGNVKIQGEKSKLFAFLTSIDINAQIRSGSTSKVWRRERWPDETSLHWCFSTFLITCCNMAGSNSNNNNRHVSTDEETEMLLGLIHEKNMIKNVTILLINLPSCTLPGRLLIPLPVCNYGSLEVQNNNSESQNTVRKHDINLEKVGACGREESSLTGRTHCPSC